MPRPGENHHANRWASPKFTHSHSSHHWLSTFLPIHSWCWVGRDLIILTWKDPEMKLFEDTFNDLYKFPGLKPAGRAHPLIHRNLGGYHYDSFVFSRKVQLHVLRTQFLWTKSHDSKLVINKCEIWINHLSMCPQFRSIWIFVCFVLVARTLLCLHVLIKMDVWLIIHGFRPRIGHGPEAAAAGGE